MPTQKTWQLQEAKARFSHVVKEATLHGPQQVSLHGEVKVIVISKQDFEKLTQPKLSFVQFMQRSPLVGIKLKITRDKTPNRDVDL